MNTTCTMVKIPTHITHTMTHTTTHTTGRDRAAALRMWTGLAIAKDLMTTMTMTGSITGTLETGITGIHTTIEMTTTLLPSITMALIGVVAMTTPTIPGNTHTPMEVTGSHRGMMRGTQHSTNLQQCSRNLQPIPQLPDPNEYLNS